jgi:Uma2 family endonuclease
MPYQKSVATRWSDAMLPAREALGVWSMRTMPSERTFRSDATFTQRTFRRWVDSRPMADINRYELVRGHIVMTPPAGWLHGSIEAHVVMSLGQHVVRHRLGHVFGSSVGYSPPSGDVLEPDASYVSAERCASCPPTRPEQYVGAVPNLVVEIRSPATATGDRTEKKAIYEGSGVDEYWIVDHRHRAVTVFSLVEGRYDSGRTMIAGTVKSRVLPKLRIAIPKLFA